MAYKPTKPYCKCGKPCAYYGKVGGFSVKCVECNAKNAERQRAGRRKRRLAKALPTVKTALIYCSFCGLSNEDVGLVIAGPGVCICSNCVAICVEAIFSHLVQTKKAPEDALVAPRKGE